MRPEAAQAQCLLLIEEYAEEFDPNPFLQLLGNRWLQPCKFGSAQLWFLTYA